MNAIFMITQDQLFSNLTNVKYTKYSLQIQYYNNKYFFTNIS